MSVTFSLSLEEQESLGQIACSAITNTLAGKTIELPKVSSQVLNEHLGSFVTININGRLRGCIGTMIGHEPLYHNVARMAHAAAFQDTRFKPLTLAEWDHAQLSISVLGPLSPCTNIEHIKIGQHGLMLKLGNKSGVFLPKVPVEQGWDLDAYLLNLCHKAGLAPNSWQNPDAQLLWYEALVFDVERISGV